MNKNGRLQMPVRHRLKLELFQREGWQEPDGKWMAMCAFGCGDILSWGMATLDRWPIMGKNHGRYVWENLRLACKECNSRNHNKKILNAKQRKRIKAREENLRHQALAEERRAAREANRRNNAAQHNVPRPDMRSFQSPQYPKHVKQKLKENYPSVEGRDVNGIIRMDL
jgi:hypothetical protein